MRSRKIIQVLSLSILILILVGLFFALFENPFSNKDEIEIKDNDLIRAGLGIVENDIPYYVQYNMNYSEISTYLNYPIESKKDLEEFALKNYYKYGEHKISLVSNSKKCIFDNNFKKEFCVKESLTFVQENLIKVTLSSYILESHLVEGVQRENRNEGENHEE